MTVTADTLTLSDSFLVNPPCDPWGNRVRARSSVAEGHWNAPYIRLYAYCQERTCGVSTRRAAISKWRDAMGATDPKKAAPGTIRNDLGTSIGNNWVHGSNAPETAAFEIGYFFSGLELV